MPLALQLTNGVPDLDGSGVPVTTGVSWDDVFNRPALLLHETFDGDSTTGTVIGPEVYTDGAFGGRAFVFSGGNYLQFPATLPTGAAERTVLLRFSDAQGVGFLFGQTGVGSAGNAFRVRVRNQEAIGISNALRFEGASSRVIGSTVIGSGEYSAAVVVPPGAANVSDVLLYLNGGLEAVSSELDATLSTLTADLFVGRDTSATESFVGNLDDFAVFSEGLSAAAIATYHAGPPPTITSVTAEVTGNTVTASAVVDDPGNGTVVTRYQFQTLEGVTWTSSQYGTANTYAGATGETVRVIGFAENDGGQAEPFVGPILEISGARRLSPAAYQFSEAFAL